MSYEKDKNMNQYDEEQPDQKDLEGVDNTQARKVRSFKLLRGYCPSNPFQFYYLTLPMKEKMNTDLRKDVSNSMCSIYSSFKDKRNLKKNIAKLTPLGNWAIIDTNYKDYMVVYSCSSTKYGNSQYVYAFTRTPDVDEFHV